MRTRFELKVWLIALLVIATLVLTGCQRQSDAVSSSPISLFRSQQINVSVELPPGWVAADGPENITLKSLKGVVSFNSWGEPGFWVHERHEGNSYTYGPSVVISQMPKGGAYIALIEINGPPPPVGEVPQEYASQDLGGLFMSHDWRKDASAADGSLRFYKWKQWYELQITCSTRASDSTVAGINALLKSWRFGDNPNLSVFPEKAIDFDLIFRDSGEELDTFNGEFSRWVYLDTKPPVSINLMLSQAEKQTIYQKMIDINYFNYPNNFRVQIPVDSAVGMVTPAEEYYFKVKFGNKYKELRWVDNITFPQDSQADKLRSLIKLIRGIFESKDEYKELPPFKVLRI